MIIKILLICSVIVNIRLVWKTIVLDVALKTLNNMLRVYRSAPITHDEAIEYLSEPIKRYARKKGK